MRGPEAIETRGVASQEELRRVNKLIASVQVPSYSTCTAWLKSMGAHTPGFRQEHTRVAYLDDALAGGLRLITVRMRIGRARLKVGGIGWVSTAPKFRNRGVCRALLADAHAYMQAHGYHACLLFGVPDLYHRFGYEVAVNDYTIQMDTAAVNVGELSLTTVRPIRHADIPALRRLHNAQEMEASCSLVRTAGDWENQFRHAPSVTPWGPNWQAAFGMETARGGLAAYAMPQATPEAVHFIEVGAGPAVCGTLLRACVAYARSNGHEHMIFHTPPDHPFSRFLRGYDSRHTTEYFRNREGMLWLADVASTIRAMVPEWEHRLAQHFPGLPPFGVTLTVGQEDYPVVFDGRTVQCAGRLPKNRVAVDGGLLARLLTGHVSGAEVLEMQRGKISDSARTLFTTIFPRRDPFVWPIDHF